MSNINEALRNAYHQGAKSGYDGAKKEILGDLIDLIVSYNYSDEAFEKVLEYLRRKGTDV